MAKSEAGAAAPTMIIPQGAEIQVDVHGQLSIRTPGNLVIQNSGHYGTIESEEGSIRIESSAEVEAVNVICDDICYVQGRLTAWKVAARSIQLEENARASIVLQETERLEVGKEARLVGNFSSEKELFLLFSRFAKHFRSMPFFFERERPLEELPGDIEGELVEGAEEEAEEAAAAPPPVAEGDGRLPEPLFFALVLLERERSRAAHGPASRRVLEEVIKLLREDEREALGATHRTLFSRIREPGKDAERARELVASYYRGEAAPPAS